MDFVKNFVKQKKARTMTNKNTCILSFQGEIGAYSNLACKNYFEENLKDQYKSFLVLPCPSFQEAIEKVIIGKADIALIPIENSSAGRVTDVHRLMLECPLKIIGEHFLRIEHCLLGTHNSKLIDIKEALSHEQALAQCAKYLKAHCITPITFVDTAKAAKYISELKDKTKAAIASSLASEIYGLKIIEKNIEDDAKNTTRFVAMAKEMIIPQTSEASITTITFQLNNKVGALYKALNIFAENMINLTKIESYLDFTKSNASFYVDLEGHINNQNLQKAFEDLAKICDTLTVFGVYKASPFRKRILPV